MRRGLAIAGLLLAGCRPEPTLKVQAAEDGWTTVPTRALQLRVGRFDGDGTVEVVAPPSLEPNPPGTVRGPAIAGTRLDVVIDGVPCVAAVLGRYEDVVAGTERQNPNRDRNPAVAPARTLRGVNVEVSCKGAPVPGSDGALRGAQAVAGVAWGLPALALGVLAGVLARKRIGPAIGCAAAAIACAGGAACGFGGLFAWTYGVLFAGVAIAGIVAGHLDRPHVWKPTAVGAAGLAIGVGAVAALHGTWSAGGPVVALLAGGGVAAIGLVGVALAAD